MFGTGRRLSELEDRLEKLQVQCSTDAGNLRGELEQLRVLLTPVETDPSRRMELLLGAIGGELETRLREALRRAAQASEVVADMTRLREQARNLSRSEASTAKRFRGSLKHVYQARWTGYVSLYFTGGVTDRVSLLIGSENPPEECVCELNSRNDINSYAGSVVRAGEFWMAKSERDTTSAPSGVLCVFTPFL